jgi:UDP-glucose 4-epimerase
LRCTVTGAGGFVGRALLSRLDAEGVAVEGWRRREGFDLSVPGESSAWVDRLRGVQAVVHLAARVHQMGEGESGGDLHRVINCEGTASLAWAAVAAGVERFVFLSTAKVFGEGGDAVYGASTPANPQDAYARSKWAAEQALLDISARTGMEVVIIRPPLVYGPGVGANFRRLWQLAALPVPLPLAAVRNRRDLVSIDNLVDVIALSLTAPVAGKVLLCSDGDPCSTAEIVARIRSVLGRPRWLFPVPPSLLRTVLGAQAGERLLGNFELDIADSRGLLGWSPRHRMVDTLGKMRDAAVP